MKPISKKLPVSKRSKKDPRPQEQALNQLGLSLLMLAAGLAGIGDLLLQKKEPKKIKSRGGYRRGIDWRAKDLKSGLAKDLKSGGGSR
jgi:hypothetical protein